MEGNPRIQFSPIHISNGEYIDCIMGEIVISGGKCSLGNEGRKKLEIDDLELPKIGVGIKEGKSDFYFLRHWNCHLEEDGTHPA